MSGAFLAILLSTVLTLPPPAPCVPRAEATAALDEANTELEKCLVSKEAAEASAQRAKVVAVTPLPCPEPAPWPVLEVTLVGVGLVALAFAAGVVVGLGAER